MLRIPNLFRGLFPDKGSKEQKKAFFTSLEEWREHPFSKELCVALQAELDASVQKDESSEGFLSFFDYKFKRAKALGARSELRKFLKHLK